MFDIDLCANLVSFFVSVGIIRIFFANFAHYFYNTMSRPPLISIITITYNAESTLPVTLESVDSQACNDFEHIIVDGNSTDSTLRLALSGGNRRVLSEPDHGLYDAMNKGLSMARGKYVIFLNAGDAFASPDILTLYARAAASDPDIIYADTDLVDGDGKVIGHRHFMVPERLTIRSFATGMKICHQAFMVRREIAPQYNMKYRFSADYDWCLRCMHNASLPDRAKNLHTVAIHYLNEGVTTKNHRSSLMERFIIMAKEYGFLPTLARHISKVFSVKMS